MALAYQPTFLDPWHRAHARVCVHATTPCAACSIALFCCTCHALRFTPGPPPASPPASTGVARLSRSPRSHSASPALFRLDVGNGPPPPGFDSHCDGHDNDAYANALAESDTCDNSSCPCGTDEPAAYTITVEQFDEGSEETYDRTFRACSACNRSCKRSFMGHCIKARIFDNSVRDALASKTRAENPELKLPTAIPSRSGVSPTPNVNESPLEVVNDLQSPMEARSSALHTTTLQDVPRSDVGPTPLEVVTALQESLHTLNNRPPTPALFVANVLTKHSAICSHPVDSCDNCSRGLICCSCSTLFSPAVSRHLSCASCSHVAFTCCTTAFCCKCHKMWLPMDSIGSLCGPARRFFSGMGSNSSPEPDIWTPSPRSSPDEIDDLTARAALPLPASRSESDAS